MTTDLLEYLSMLHDCVIFSTDQEASEGIRLSETGKMGDLYLQYVNSCIKADIEPLVTDVWLRSDDLKILTIVISVYILGE